MKIAQLLDSIERPIGEIYKLSSTEFRGGKKSLTNLEPGETAKPLPWNPKLVYSVVKHSSVHSSIKVWDPANKGEFVPYSKEPTRRSYGSDDDFEWHHNKWLVYTSIARDEYDRSPGKLVGQLEINVARRFPIPNAVEVSTITVDEDYRGIGIAKSMYRVVLEILKRVLVAGDSQTLGGRRNWVSLSQMPGVDLKGYFSLKGSDISTIDTTGLSGSKLQDAQEHNKVVEKNIDTIMGKLGGQYLGNFNGNEYFAFDVEPTATNRELKAYIKTHLSTVYGPGNTGLYAIWTGAA
jgi:GNAT superfamily N-acetyltransferase